ncbi:MAG TPA: DUF2974 domain-containing protein [Desulfitobacterium dehalogenans]|uniref:DUF2974 domain-containing protein n=1 Tax=Desulfitobacterium dehalogenans TaxID=36854 RepID=A0A7C7D692_9FIRM|nr:DUF2974 domain-containing protein [Desulfitobacterium dehalogenans]
MQNIFDYLDWRGDLSFAQDGFNEVDNLIFSVLAYLEFDGILPSEDSRDSISLTEAGEQYFKGLAHQKLRNSINPFFREIPKLLIKASLTTRFKEVQLSSYVNLVDHEICNQFSAMVFSINQEEHFIAFRGTDDTLAGWKEDFQMSFRDEVKAQRDAISYAGKIAGKYSGKLYLGGHSKGGNLAVYAAAAMEREAQDRVIGVYNNDGPGFLTHVLEQEGYQRLLDRIHTFVPKSSVVGMLLEHGEEYITVNSNGLSVMQHNAFFWEVRGAHFVYEKGLTKGSKNFNRTVRLWLNQLSMEQRAEFVDALFDILQATGAMTVSDLSQKKLSLANDMIKSYKTLDPLTKSHLKKTLKVFFDKTQKVWISSFEADVVSLLARAPNKKKRSTVEINNSIQDKKDRR